MNVVCIQTGCFTDIRLILRLFDNIVKCQLNIYFRYTSPYILQVCKILSKKLFKKNDIEFSVIFGEMFR